MSRDKASAKQSQKGKDHQDCLGDQPSTLRISCEERTVMIRH